MAGSKNEKTGSATSSDEQDQQTNGLGEAATEATQQIQDQVVNLTQQVRQQATDQMLSQKDRVVDTLDTVALLLNQAGEHAQQQDKAMLAGYADRAAEQVAQWSDALRGQDVPQLLEETRQFARRQPMLFVGGALAAGFLGARFFRSSAQQSQQPDQYQTDTAPQGSGALGADLPPYDIDQPVDAGLGTAGVTPLAADTPPLADMTTPEVGGVLEDYESAVLEGKNAGATSLADTDDFSTPERV